MTGRRQKNKKAEIQQGIFCCNIRHTIKNHGEEKLFLNFAPLHWLEAFPGTEILSNLVCLQFQLPARKQLPLAHVILKRPKCFPIK